MEALVYHVLKPIVQHPDAIDVKVVDGEASVLFELSVHAEDRPLLEAEDRRILRSIRTLLSAAAGRRKASLDLVDDDVLGAEE